MVTKSQELREKRIAARKSYSEAVARIVVFLRENGYDVRHDDSIESLRRAVDDVCVGHVGQFNKQQTLRGEA